MRFELTSSDTPSLGGIAREEGFLRYGHVPCRRLFELVIRAAFVLSFFWVLLAPRCRPSPSVNRLKPSTAT